MATSLPELLEICRAYLDHAALCEIEKAHALATEAHAGQWRCSGEPYVTHPTAVAAILANMRLDRDSIIAALLHDVIEDSRLSKADLSEKFNAEVAELVDGVSKLTQIKFQNRAQAQAENFRKMILAMVGDIRVIIVKLADRLHNMRTIEVLSADRRRRIAKETLDIYAPIANRLGMHTFCIEFEELCFRALYPMRYRVLKEVVRNARGNQEEIITDIKSVLEGRIFSAGIHCSGIWGREKNLYGIYQKMRNKHLQFSEIMDVYAFRIIVSKVDECYRVLGIVHNLYKPVPERFKDYIAIPKANGYQSLHTTLFGPYGVPIEIQIRTEKMDKMADSGIAAHWRYKRMTDSEEAEEVSINDNQKRAEAWIQSLLEMPQAKGDSIEFVENVKIELFPDEVYVFTPKGAILELPAGATAVDFAYAVHSDIGNTCVAAKIDRRLAPLSTILSNGQTVEIVSAVGARPNPAWLQFVATGKARSNIRHAIREQKQSEAIQLGVQLLTRALEVHRLHYDAVSSKQKEQLLAHFSLEHWETLLESIGRGELIPMLVAQQLTEKQIAAATVSSLTASPVMIKGASSTIVTFASCCSPVPGDPIVGLLKTGEGLLVHAEDCPRVDQHRTPGIKSKLIPVCWAEQINDEFKVQLRVDVKNQRGVLAKIALATSEADANINDIQIFELDRQYSFITLTISVSNRKHLAQVIRRIRRHHSVGRIVRVREEDNNEEEYD